MAFWDNFFRKKSDSASNAVNRIKFVLQSDRSGLPPETLEKIKNDIISVLSKYVDIDTKELDFNINSETDEVVRMEVTTTGEDPTPTGGELTPALCANIPIKGVKRASSNDKVSKE